MRLKATLQNKVAKRLFSVERRNAKRRKAERARQASQQPHLIEYFHEASDPYSQLMVQLLPRFLQRYDIELNVHVTPPPPDWAAPDRARLDAYARKDAARLAQRAGLAFSDPGQQPSPGALAAAQAALVAAREAPDFLQQAIAIGERLWALDATNASADMSHSVENVLTAAAARRDELGHYLGGTLYYAGEWYWGPDRLHFLETRLQTLGGVTSDAVNDVLYTPPTVLKLRYVLPMVMRGMKVPRKKGFYIMGDTVREAERLGVAFGNSVDPVGRPVERGYAILHEAIRRGRGYEFVQSFLSGVWADGLDAGSDKGLRKITERAGLPWSEMQPLLGGDHWRAEAEANQQEMFSYGIWRCRDLGPGSTVGD